jgi:hypothetical protein
MLKEKQGKRIGVWGACDTGGLSASLALLLHNYQVSALRPPTEEGLRNAWIESMRERVDILVVPISWQLPGWGLTFQLDVLRKAGLQVISYPLIVFGAFHPDMCFVYRGSLTSPIFPHYNSKIVAWSYANKVPIDQAATFFNESVFSLLGYFDAWNPEVSKLQLEFEKCNLDFQFFYWKVKRMGAFMHSFNHPKIQTIVALAKCITVKLVGRSEFITDTSLEIPDGLSHADWPIYPEIGERLSLRTSYRWSSEKTGGASFTLPEYIHHAYSKYEEFGLDGSEMIYEDSERTNSVLRPLLGH